MKRLKGIVEWLDKTKYPNATYTFNNVKFTLTIVGFELFIIGLWVICEKTLSLVGSPYEVPSFWFSIPITIIGLILSIIGMRKVYNKNSDVSNVCARESTSSSEGGS